MKVLQEQKGKGFTYGTNLNEIIISECFKIYFDIFSRMFVINTQ